MSDAEVYVEQYCESCHAETDQEAEPAAELARCLRCGSRNRVRGEADRIRALIDRVREDDLASLGRLRASAVPTLQTTL